MSICYSSKRTCVCIPSTRGKAMHSSYACNPRVEAGGCGTCWPASLAEMESFRMSPQHPFLASTCTCTCIPPHIQGPNIVRGQRSRVTHQFSSLSRVPRYPIFPLRTLGNKVRRNEDLELEPPHPVPFPHQPRVRVTSLTGGPFGPGNPGGP
jgi:hypothetical protein